MWVFRGLYYVPYVSMRTFHSVGNSISCTLVWALGIELWELVNLQFPGTLSFAGNCSVPSLMEDQLKHVQLSSKPDFLGDLSAVFGRCSLWSVLFTGTLLQTFQPPLLPSSDFCLLNKVRMQSSFWISFP